RSTGFLTSPRFVFVRAPDAPRRDVETRASRSRCGPHLAGLPVLFQPLVTRADGSVFRRACRAGIPLDATDFRVIVWLLEKHDRKTRLLCESPGRIRHPM